MGVIRRDRWNVKRGDSRTSVVKKYSLGFYRYILGMHKDINFRIKTNEGMRFKL